MTQKLSMLINVPRAMRRAFFARCRKQRGCWPWTAYIGNQGYGVFAPAAGQRIGAHRMSWVIHRGPIPRGKWVLHKCDNRVCIRPDHLFLGTNLDNVKDCIQKGRHRGAHQKLTDTEVKQIQCDPRPQRSIALDYGITQAYVSKIKNNICARTGFDYMQYMRKYFRKYRPTRRFISLELSGINAKFVEKSDYEQRPEDTREGAEE